MIAGQVKLWVPFEGNGNDYSGLGNHTTAANGATYASSLQGRYGSQPNSNSYWYKSSPNTGIGGTDELTCAAWIKVENRTNQNIFSLWGGSGSEGYINFYVTSSRTQLRLLVMNLSKTNLADCLVSVSALTTGTWYHLAATWKRSLGSGTGATETNKRFQFYINGALQTGTKSNNYTQDVTSCVSVVGANGIYIGDPSANWNPQATDEAMVFNKALPQSDIVRIYSGLHPISI